MHLDTPHGNRHQSQQPIRIQLFLPPSHSVSVNQVFKCRARMEILRFFRLNLNLLWEPYFITITGNCAWGNFVDKSQQELKNFVSRSKLKDLIITVRKTTEFGCLCACFLRRTNSKDLSSKWLLFAKFFATFNFHLIKPWT